MSAVSKALAFIHRGDGDLNAAREARKARAMKMAAGKPPVNLKAFRDAIAASEATTSTVGPGCVPAASESAAAVVGPGCVPADSAPTQRRPTTTPITVGPGCVPADSAPTQRRPTTPPITVGPGCVPAATAGATPPARKCFGCGVVCTRHDFCHTCREHFCMHCDRLPAPPRNHSPQDHLKAP